MAKRGRKKVPVPEQSNKILSYLNRDAPSLARGILDELITTLDLRNESETVVSEILESVISGVHQTQTKSKHSGETVTKETIENWKQKFPWVIIRGAKDSDDPLRLQCEYCKSAKQKLAVTNVWAFEGSPSIQSSSLVRHNASLEHKNAVSHIMKLQTETDYESAEIDKETVPTHVDPKEKILFNTAYYVAKEQESSEKINRLLDLQKKNGLATGYQNLSWDTITDIQDSICSVITDSLVSDINRSPCFALMLDESTDICIEKRLSICVRYVKLGVAITKFLINVPLKDGCARTIVAAVAEQCGKLGIDLTKMTSLATDGASVLMGRKSGVGVQMQSSIPPLPYRHIVSLIALI